MATETIYFSSLCDALCKLRYGYLTCVYCGQAEHKEELLNMELLIADSDVATVVQ